MDPQASDERRQTVQLVWIVSATISVLSTRYILFNLNWHWPLCLTVLQLLGLTGFYHFEHQLSQRYPNHHFSSGQSVKQSWGAVVACAILFMGPMALFNQTIFSFPNTATLMMLLMLVNIIRIFQDGNFFDLRIVLRLFLFQAAVAACVIFDSRLEGDAMVYAIIAVGLYALFSTTIRKLLVTHGSEFTSVRPWSFAPALVLTLVLVFSFEKPSRAAPAFFHSGVELWLMVILNIGFTCLAIYTGGSPHIYGMLPEHEEDTSVSKTPIDIWPTTVVAGLISVILSSSGLVIISPYQVLGYFIAILCSEIRPIDIFGWCSERIHGKPSLAQYTSVDLDDQTAKTEDVEVGQSPLDSTITDRFTGFRRNFIFSAAFFWIAVLMFSLSEVFAIPPASRSAYLDTVYRPTADLDIVISMYKEPMSDLTKTIDLITGIQAVASRNPRIYIYVKDQDADLDLTRTTLSFQNPIVTLLPNIGREGETYLNHILTQWDNLANHTMFIQAETHTPREMLPRIRDYYHASTGMLSLSFIGNTCDCNSNLCTDRYWSDNSGLIQQTYLKANRLTECPSPNTKILLSYKGQFIASAARIRGVDRKVYADLQQLFTDENSYVHSKEYLSMDSDLTGTKDRMSQPVFGFSMERLWSSLMQCDDVELARRCPSLLSGWRTGGSRSDCQCLD
ncbi:hypothetical protein MBLNU457_7078t1 [Dothideomycetes sp. NU457]